MMIGSVGRQGGSSVKDKRNWLPLLVNLVGVGLLLLACGPGESTGDSAGITVPPEAEAIVAHIRQDLAAQLNVTIDEVQVTAIEPVEWSDTSLGCPDPDFMYVQVTTPGYRVSLEVDGTEYVYHTGPNHFVRCEAASSDEEPAHLIRTDPTAATLGLEAQQDLSQLLGISLDEVTVVSVEAVDWPDSSLGCPEPGMMYLQMVTPGYRIVVAGEGEEYAYHTDHTRAVRCEQ